MRVRRSLPLTRCVGLLSMVGCVSLLEPRPPMEGAVEFMRPEFAVIWESVGRCSGLRADMGSVRFFAVTDMGQKDGRAVWGYYRHPENQIFVLTSLYREDDQHPIYNDSIRRVTVAHEMLHATLALTTGEHGHPQWAGERCRSVIDSGWR